MFLVFIIMVIKFVVVLMKVWFLVKMVIFVFVFIFKVWNG